MKTVILGCIWGCWRVGFAEEKIKSFFTPASYHYCAIATRAALSSWISMASPAQTFYGEYEI